MKALRITLTVGLASMVLAFVGCDGGGRGEADSSVTLEDARELYERGEAREALAAALQLAEDPPQELPDRIALADFLSRMSASVRAVEILDSWNGELDVDGSEILARALLRSGNTVRALNLLGEIAAEGNGSPRVPKLLGMGACARGDWAEAERLLEASQAGDPSDPECWAWLGWARVRAGKADRGMRVLREGLRKFEGSWEIRSMLAAVLFRLRAEDEFALREVVTLTRWVAEHHPFDREARVRLGAALGRLERHAQSEEVLSELVTDFPSQVGYRIDLGIAQVRGGRALRAVLTLEDALPLAPRDTRVLLNLALAYLEASSLVRDAAVFAAKSKRTFRKVLDLDERCADAYIGMARATIRPAPSDDGLAMEGMGYYLEALKIDPDSFPANLNVALLYYDLTVHSDRAVASRDDWFQKALFHFRAAEKVVDVSQWDNGARNAFQDLKSR